VPTAKSNPNLNYSPERVVSAAAVEDDSSFELKLRPQRLGEFIGQAKVKENLAVAIEAARSRGEAMDHVLLYGPPGLGKTTLANIIANELGVHFQPTAAPLLQIKGDLTAIIRTCRTSKFCSSMKFTGCSRCWKSCCIRRWRITSSTLLWSGAFGAHAYAGGEAVYVCGCDHAGGLISAPLRSRFGIVLRLEFYTPGDLRVIVERSAEILGVQVDDGGRD